MKRRCLNKNEKSYIRYGGQGVVVCAEWLNFQGFYKDMAQSFIEGLSLERIDNDKGYSKENCKWIPLAEQGKNKRSVPLYEFNGLKLNASDWDRKLGLKRGAVRARILKYKWPLQKALTSPKTTYKGVFRDNRGLYRVEVNREGKKHFVGRFTSEQAAISARLTFLAKLLT